MLSFELFILFSSLLIDKVFKRFVVKGNKQIGDFCHDYFYYFRMNICDDIESGESATWIL